MHELGNVQTVAQDIRALTQAKKKLPNPGHEQAQIQIPDDDADAAVIDSWHTQNDKQSSQYDDAPTSANQVYKAKLDSKTKTIESTSWYSRFHIYSDPSELQVKLANEIKAINSYDGFLLGVHDKIEKFPRHSWFGLEQILEVEQHRAELYETLELYKFTLRRIREETVKAIRCQGNLGPQRVLQLLKDTIANQNAAIQTEDPQNTTISEQNE